MHAAPPSRFCTRRIASSRGHTFLGLQGWPVPPKKRVCSMHSLASYLPSYTHHIFTLFLSLLSHIIFKRYPFLYIDILWGAPKMHFNRM